MSNQQKNSYRLLVKAEIGNWGLGVSYRKVVKAEIGNEEPASLPKTAQG